MAVQIQTELRIPDLWFDVYALLLPGAVFVAAVRFLVLNERSMPSAMEFILLLGAGYLAALVSHPFTAWITGKIHRRAEREHGRAEGFTRRVKRELGAESRRALILGKMHGQTTFFVQLAVLDVVFIALQLKDVLQLVVKDRPIDAAGLSASVLGIPALLALGVAVSDRLVKRAIEETPPSVATPSSIA